MIEWHWVEQEGLPTDSGIWLIAVRDMIAIQESGDRHVLQVELTHGAFHHGDYIIEADTPGRPTQPHHRGSRAAYALPTRCL